MPGLVAVLTKGDRPADGIPVEAMARSMWHESFYQIDRCDSASKSFRACRVHIAVPGTEPQPLYNEDGTVLAMVDGELRLSEDVRRRLVSNGHRLNGHNPAELLVHLYEEHGESLATEIDGRFLAVIHDARTDSTVIVNDRFGLYRAFYASCDGAFIVASEMKCLLQYDRRFGSLNVERLGQYFLYDGVLDDETLFKGIRRLPPGSVWTYKAGNLSRRQSFRLSDLDARRTGQDERDFGDRATELFRDAVLADTGQTGVGVSITGGWDSRAVLAVMSAAGRTGPCYTWCSPLRDSLDVRLARRLVKSTGQELHVFTLGKDFFDDFEEYAKRTTYISDGCADVFRSHELYFNRAVRRVAPIRVTGAYGTEIASRNPYFLKAHRIDGRIFSERFVSDCGDLSSCERSFESAEAFMNGLRWLFPSGNYAIERSALEVRWPYVNQALVEHFFTAPPGYLGSSRVQKYIICKCSRQLAMVPSDKGAYIKSPSPARNLGLHLWATLIRIASNADNAYVHFNVPHPFTRADPFMRGLRLDRLLMGRRNLVSYRIWVKGALRRFFESMLLDERTLARGHYDPGFIRRMTNDHFTDRANYTREIGKIVSLEMFYRTFID